MLERLGQLTFAQMHLIRSVLLLLALSLGAPAAIEAQTAPSVGLTVTDLRSANGQLIVCLWSTSAEFPTCQAGDAIPRHTFAVTGRTMRVTVPLLRAGRYAVTVYHDENRNGRLGTNFIGMPTEGVGVSNNPGGRPRFATSVIDLAPGGSLSVRMRYLFG